MLCSKEYLPPPSCLFSILQYFRLVYYCHFFCLLESFPCHVASRGKEVSAPTTKTKDAELAALDYVDIPHSQIRKVC